MLAGFPGSTPCGPAQTGHGIKWVRRNDEITTEAWLKDLIVHDTRFSGRAVQQIYHVNFYNQYGDVVSEADSWCFRTDRDFAREEGTKYTELRREIETPLYTGGNRRSLRTLPRRRDSGRKAAILG